MYLYKAIDCPLKTYTVSTNGFAWVPYAVLTEGSEYFSISSQRTLQLLHAFLTSNNQFHSFVVARFTLPPTDTICDRNEDWTLGSPSHSKLGPHFEQNRVPMVLGSSAIGLLVKTSLGWIRSFVANPNYVVNTRFLVHYFLKNVHYFQFFRH